jgi:antitoxin component of RelBE/YafQ-DinJ toxin-antitoxin module
MKTTMSFKVDRDVRDRARRAAKAIGLPLSTIVNAQLRDFAEERRIEFREPFVPNPRTAKILREAMKEIKARDTRGWSPPFERMDHAIAWLHKKG